jgi:ribosomal protein L11 methyltransferase
VDWTQAWARGLRAIEVSERLIVRPSSVAWELGPHQLEVVIDPGIVFGTGTHASTRLALEWICELESGTDEFRAFDGFGPGVRVLDVGTGTGLLALAALRLGAGLAVGFDLDPLAPPEALHWARHNSLAEDFHLFTGPIEALAGPPFELALVNMFRTEMLPIAPALSERVASGGLLILSGLLVSERDGVERAMQPLGFETRGAREHLDDTGDHWLSLLLERR